MKYITLLFIPMLVFGFGTGTIKQIDQIDNNTETDILLNPTSKVTVTGLLEGELLYYNNGISSLTNGSEGQLLSITGGVLDFIDPPASSPLTTKGDLYTYDTDNQRLPVGTDTQILSANSATATGLEWIAQPSTSPTTTIGDIIYNNTGASAGDTRLAIGTENQLLTVISGAPSWQNAPEQTTLTTKGDIQTYDTANARLPVGNDGEFIVADSAETTGLKWSNQLQGVLNPVTDMTSYTPTTQGLGTISSVEISYKKVGDTIIVKGSFVTGTTTAVEAQISLPNGYTVKGTSSSSNVGVYFRSQNTALKGGAILATNGDSFVNIGDTSTFSNTSVNPLSPSTGSASIGTSQRVTVDFEVPVNELSSGLNTVVENRTLDSTTTNVFKVNVANNGTITIGTRFPNEVWYDSIVRGSQGVVTIGYTSLGLTSLPSYNVSEFRSGARNRNCTVTALSLTAITIGCENISGLSVEDTDFSLELGKTNADINSSLVIVANLNNSTLSGTVSMPDLPIYADDAAAGVGGLVQGDVYQTVTGELRIKI